MGIAKRAEKPITYFLKPERFALGHHNSTEKGSVINNSLILLSGRKNLSFPVIVLLTLFFLLSISGKITAQPQSQTFTSGGSFTVPEGVTQVTVECWGGGGGGGRARGNPSTGGGGAGGSYVRSTLNVSPGSNYTVTAGSGGNGGNGTGPTTQHGSAGGDSWFGSVSTIIAKGGAGGLSDGNVNNSNGSPGLGSTTGCIGDIIYAGGNGSQGNFAVGSGYSGAGGGGAGTTGPGGNATSGSGGSGTTLHGGNGANGAGNNSVGLAGSTYGGGGSGGKANNNNDRNGGNGAGGQVIVSWILPPSLNSSLSGIDFGYIPSGSVSAVSSYSISSPYLIGAPGNISVSAPSGYEISLSPASGFGSFLNIPFTGSTLTSTTIYVRFVPSTPNTVYNGAISHSGGGASLDVAVTGTTILDYCTPSYTSGTSDGDYISLVQLGSINNATGPLAAPYYFYYSNLSTDLTAGASYTITLSAGTYTSENNITVWIDYNQNGVFEAPEKLGNVTLGAAPATGTINFTVPAGTATGTTRMRVREVWNNNSLDPCASYSYGEAEDYNVNIIFPCTLSVTASSTETCLGSPTGTGTITVTGINGTPPYLYSLSGGTYQSAGVFTELTAGSYVVTVKDLYNCEASTNIAVNDPPTSDDDQTVAGTDVWKGHLYDGTNFNNYMGHFDEAELFDQDFGGNLNCFQVNSGASVRSVYTETFSVRYRMNSTRKGLYIADFGSDDGSRLFVDGQEVYNDWSDHSFRSRPRVLFSLSGSSNLAYEFYENGGANRVVFQNLTQLLANSLTVNTEQTLCTGEAGIAISGDIFGTLPSGISLQGTGYQWTYSTTPDGARTAITGATEATFTPDVAVAPFDVPGTYYIYRNAILRSTNNVSPDPCIAVNESNVAIVTVINVSGIPITYPGSPYCNSTGNPQPVVINGPSGGTFSASPAGLALNAVTGDITPSASLPGAYTITYFYPGCGGLTSTNTVEIIEVLPVSVSITANPNPFCPGAAVTFTATPVNGGENPVYQWKLNGINAGPDSPAWIIENPQPGDAVYCEIISDDPCSGGNVAASNTIVISAAASLSNNSLNIGNGNHGSVCATANENSDATVNAPAGTVILHVEFASYGTPEGSCNNFTYGSCHAGTSFSVAENYLLGNNSAVIPATNAVFGDPCVGTYKRLYIQTIYGQPICIGSTPGQISGSMPAGGDGNYTFLWESSTTGPLSGFAPAPGINDQQHYTPESLSTTTWFRRTVYSAGCSDISRVLLIPVSGHNVWTGAIDTDWNNPGNWSCYIPNLTTDVSLNSGLTNYPVLSAGIPGMVRNLTIESGTSLTISGNTMQIAGAISNSGTIDATAGSIEMKGIITQVIPPATFLNNTVTNLIISNSQGVYLTGELNIKGYVKAADGNLAADGYLTLISSETETALIDGSGNGEVTGDVHMQRYLASAFGYKYVSSPFSDATVAGFAEETDLGASFAEFYRYDEDRESTGWVAYTYPAGPLSPMSGYAANTGSTPAPMLMSLTGRVNNGVLAPVALLNHDKTYTRGFNLVGNPYPSPINWDAPEGWVRTNIDDAVYFFEAGGADRYAGTYSTYINGVSSDGSAGPVIASMQGFFVHVSDGAYPVEGQFGMDNRVRVNNLSTTYYKNTETEYRPLIRLSAAYEGTGKNIDHLAVYFVENSTPVFDSGLDAIKLENTDPEVPDFYSITECGRRLSVGAWPLSQTHEIPLGIKTEKHGMLTFSLISEENLPQGKRVYLKDKANGTVQDLKLKSAYKTSLAAGEVNERFTLLFSDYDLSQETFGSGSADALVRDGLIYAIVRLRDEQVVVKLHNMAGQQLMERTLYGEGEHRLGQAPAPGVYIMSVFTGMGTISKKIIL